MAGDGWEPIQADDGWDPVTDFRTQGKVKPATPDNNYTAAKDAMIGQGMQGLPVSTDSDFVENITKPDRWTEAPLKQIYRERIAKKAQQDIASAMPSEDMEIQDRPGLPMRAAHGVATFVQDAIVNTGNMGMAAMDRLGLGGVIGTDDEIADMYNQSVAEKQRFAAEMPKAETWAEKGIDIGAGLAPYVGAGVLALPLMINNAVVGKGEQSLEQGDDVGTATTRAALGGYSALAFGKLPGGRAGVLGAPVVGMSDRLLDNMLAGPKYRESVVNPEQIFTDMVTMKVLNVSHGISEGNYRRKFDSAANDFVNTYAKTAFDSGAFETMDQSINAGNMFLKNQLELTRKAQEQKSADRTLGRESDPNAITPDNVIDAIKQSTEHLKDSGNQFTAESLRQMVKDTAVAAEGRTEQPVDSNHLIEDKAATVTDPLAESAEVDHRVEVPHTGIADESISLDDAIVAANKTVADAPLRSNETAPVSLPDSIAGATSVDSAIQTANNELATTDKAATLRARIEAMRAGKQSDQNIIPTPSQLVEQTNAPLAVAPSNAPEGVLPVTREPVLSEQSAPVPEVTYSTIQRTDKGWQTVEVTAPVHEALKHHEERVSMLDGLLDCVGGH